MFNKYSDFANLSYITFGSSSNHSYTRYGLLINDIKYGKPQLITTIIKTPRGSRDITDAVSHKNSYDLRTIAVTFVIPEGNHNDIYRFVEDELDGKYFEDIYISKYESHFIGRVLVDSFTTDVKAGLITLKIIAEPVRFNNVVEEKYTYRLQKDTPTIQEVNYELGATVYAKSSGTLTSISTSSVEGGAVTVALSQTAYTKIGVINSSSPSFNVEFTGTATGTYTRTVSFMARKEEIA